jgi:hypothetical protein
MLRPPTSLLLSTLQEAPAPTAMQRSKLSTRMHETLMEFASNSAIWSSKMPTKAAT